MDTLKTYYFYLVAKKTMSDQKDTQKTSVNIYDKSFVSDEKSLQNEAIYDFANKKTEKLVTALYMVTDCMESDDALKNKLRLLGVDFLSNMYKLSALPAMDRYKEIPISLARINEILSFIEISFNIGFISEMNTMILKKEFNDLSDQLKMYKSKDKHFTFTLDDKMFNLPNEDYVLNGNGFNYKGHDYIKDNAKGQIDKRTMFNNLSFIKGQSPIENQNKKPHSNYSNLAEKEERKNKILSLIKNMPDSQNGASIKDISMAFIDCSEKTIQRDLNTLVSGGKLLKTGAKRWSRYGIITN